MTTIEFDKKVKCNAKFVAVRILDNNDEIKVGNIYMPASIGANDRVAFGIIEDVGEKAAAEYGLEKGQYVLFDRLSTFCHTAPVALLEYNNVICLTNSERSEYHPLKGMMFVKPDNTEDVTNVKGIYVPNYAEKLNTGHIVDSNFTSDVKDNFKIGDRVLLVKGGDVIELGESRIHIFKEDMLVCSIED